MAFFFNGAAEGVFHCVAIRQVKQVMDCEARSSLPANLHSKVALIVVEGVDFLPEEVRDVPWDIRACSVLAAVHKNPFLFRMSMQVDKEKAILLLHYRLLCVIDLRAAGLTVIVPHAIEIIPRKTASVAAIDYSIRIEHWNDLEDKVISKSLGLIRVGN